MLTKFKIFENKQDSRFWVVKNDENLKVRLFKIGMPEKIIENMIEQININYRTDNFFYVGYDYDGWTYSKYNYTSGYNIYKADDFKYMGHVYINNNDIYNYENRKDLKKYNL